MGLLSGIGSIAGGFFGGPVGASIGGTIGGMLEGGGDGAGQAAAGQAGAAAADPFGKYRNPFAQMLLDLYGIESPEASAPSAGGIKEIVMGVAGNRNQRFMPNDGGFYSGAKSILNIGEQAATTVANQPTAEDRQQAQMDRIKNLPGYQFQQDEIQRATSRGASAVGGVGSGKMFTELQDRAGNLASLTFSQEVQRLMTLSGADRGSPGTAGQLIAQGATDAANIKDAKSIGISNALGYAAGQIDWGGNSGGGGGGTTTWGDSYVNTDYGPVIPRDGFNY